MIIIPIAMHKSAGAGGWSPHITGTQLEAIPDESFYATIYKMPDDFLWPWCVYIYKKPDYHFRAASYRFTEWGARRAAARLLRKMRDSKGLEVIQ